MIGLVTSQPKKVKKYVNEAANLSFGVFGTFSCIWTFVGIFSIVLRQNAGFEYEHNIPKPISITISIRNSLLYCYHFQYYVQAGVINSVSTLPGRREELLLLSYFFISVHLYLCTLVYLCICAFVHSYIWCETSSPAEMIPSISPLAGRAQANHRPTKPPTKQANVYV